MTQHLPSVADASRALVAPPAWALDAAQIQLLRSAPPLSVALGFAHAVVLVLPFIGLVPGVLLAAWLLLFALVCLARSLVAHVLQCVATDAASTRRSSLWLLSVAALQSLVWGLGSWLLLTPPDMLAETVLHVVLAAVLCGNVRQLSNGYPVLVVYTLGIGVPLVLRDIWIGDQHLALAALFALLAGLTLFEGLRQARAHADARRQRREIGLLVSALEHEVQARTQAHAQAEQALAAKAGFLAAASHDLRQPLNAIGLLVQALPLQASGRQTAEIAKQAFSGVQQMVEIVDDLLALAQWEAGAIVPEPSVFDIAPLLLDVAAMHRPIAARLGLRLHVQAECLHVHTDVRLLRRVLVNLVSNALRYTPQGDVRLSARQVEHAVEVRVQDTGIGMDAHALQRVFQAFYQVANPTRDSHRATGWVWRSSRA